MNTTAAVQSAAAHWILPVVTFLLGFATKFVTDWLEHNRAMTREREARQTARREQMADRRIDFQRQTLFDLQEAVVDLMRATAVINLHDEMAYRRTGQWQREPLDDEVDQQGMMAMRRVSICQVRLRDEKLRQSVAELRRLSARVAPNVDRNAAQAATRAAANLFEEIQERIGELLRTLYDEEYKQ